MSGAQRLSLDFRFRTGSKELDNKALVGIDLVGSMLTDLKYNGSNVLLLGFADSRGTRAMNQVLSENRAKEVAGQFQMRGITPSLVRGFWFRYACGIERLRRRPGTEPPSRDLGEKIAGVQHASGASTKRNQLF